MRTCSFRIQGITKSPGREGEKKKEKALGGNVQSLLMQTHNTDHIHGSVDISAHCHRA